MGWWIGGIIKHFHVNRGQHEFARGNCPINGIESFWSYAKRRLVKFNGVPRKIFHLHLLKNNLDSTIERKISIISYLGPYKLTTTLL